MSDSRASDGLLCIGSGLPLIIHRPSRIAGVTSYTFQTRDRRFIAEAIQSNVGHKDLDTFELGLGVNTQDKGAIPRRVAALVSYMFGQLEDTDEAVYDLLNYVFITDTRGESRMETPPFKALQNEVFGPREVKETDMGFRRVETMPSSGEDAAFNERSKVGEQKAHRILDTFGEQKIPESLKIKAKETKQDASENRVFIVHGRDHSTVQVLKQYLHFVGVGVLTWEDAIAMTGESAPDTFSIVKTGLSRAAAIVVLFTPDDLAQLNPTFSGEYEQFEPLTGQPRQNVLLEAGMAFAMAPKRTVFIRAGKLRPISDIQGMHWAEMSGTWESRQGFNHRLASAGLKVTPAYPDLRNPLAGTFKPD